MITRVDTADLRFDLEAGAGADSVHSAPQYSYGTVLLGTDAGLTGTGLAFTLGGGNDLVCRAASLLAEPLAGRSIEAVMADFGTLSRQLADHHQLRWLGPHKGVVHLALAAVVNACFDLWAKARGVPLWRLLLDLTPPQLVALLDLSYLEDELGADQALALIEAQRPTRRERESVIARGYPGYDTSVGWFHYPDEQVRANATAAVAAGFTALKLKVGSADAERDVRRARLVRDAVGPGVRLMLDANQQWTLPRALQLCRQLAAVDPYWIEEPTHPDDVPGHRALAQAIAPLQLALGEHVPNRVLFKSYLQAGAVGFAQVDCTRVAGISEFLAVSLLCHKFGVPVVPHVGDMGQLHQHLVLVNHVALGLPALFLEYIPHLRDRFLHPARVEGGVYRTPQEPGSGSDFTRAALARAR